MGKTSFSRLHYTLLAVTFLALALYGSLVPFHYQALPLGEAVERFRQIPYLKLGIASRSDWVANILLFIPLGFLIMASLSADRPWRIGLIAAMIVIPVCIALSITIEFVQIFFPVRTVSVNDIVAESIGGTTGTVLWLAAGQRITLWARHIWSATEGYGLAGRLLWGYVCFLIFIHVMPLDLAISPVEVYHKYKEGRIVLVPFATPYTSLYKLVEKNVWNILYFMPVGFLLAGIRGWGEHWRLWPKILAAGLALSGLIEFLQLFVYTRFTDVTDIVTGTQSVLLGWSISIWDRASEMNARPGSYRLMGGEEVRTESRIFVARPILITFWCMFLIFLNWQPFDFNFNRASLLQRLNDFSLVPFADYYRGTEYNAFNQILHKTLMFMPIGPLASGMRASRKANLVAVVAGFALSVTCEVGQLFLPARFCSVSDVIVETVGAWLGFQFVLWLREARGRIASHSSSSPIV